MRKTLQAYMEKHLGGLHHPAVYTCDHERLEPPERKSVLGIVTKWNGGDPNEDSDDGGNDSEKDEDGGGETQTAETFSATLSPVTAIQNANGNSNPKANSNQDQKKQ